MNSKYKHSNKNGIKIENKIHNKIENICEMEPSSSANKTEENSIYLFSFFSKNL